MKENLRLKKIAEMISKGMIVADIGTDHAFLPIMLVQNGISDRVYACDVAEGPLKGARENIAKSGLSDRISTILTDGLHDVPMDTDCVVIAGMLRQGEFWKETWTDCRSLKESLWKSIGIRWKCVDGLVNMDLP